MGSKKAFKVLEVGVHRTLAIGPGKVVCVPKHNNYCDDPSFGKDFTSALLGETEPVFGVVWKTEPTVVEGETKVIVIMSDPKGNAIVDDNSNPKFIDFIATLNDEVGLNVWCDDPKAVISICNKHNIIGERELERIEDAIRTKRNHLKSVIEAINGTISNAKANSEVVIEMKDVTTQKEPVIPNNPTPKKDAGNIDEEYFDQESPINEKEE